MDSGALSIQFDTSPAGAVPRPVLSLFSGAGGLDQGFAQAGFESVLAIDINRAAVATYARNHPSAKTICMDLATTDPATILDLWEENAGGAAPVGIIGGPPCQAFSSSNVHQVENDPRRKLLDNYARIITSFAERYTIDFFLVENVPSLIHNKHKTLFDEFQEVVRESDFEVISNVLDAGTFGVPQHRKRLIAVGVNRKRYPNTELQLLEGSCHPTPPVRLAIKDLPEPAFCAKGAGTRRRSISPQPRSNGSSLFEVHRR